MPMLTPAASSVQSPEKTPTYSCAWNSIPDEPWNRLVADFHDASIYQTATYARARMRGFPVWRLALRRDGRVVGLATVRIYRLPFLPFGLALVTLGPLWHRRNHVPESADLRQLLKALWHRICVVAGLQLVVKPMVYEHDADAPLIERIFQEESFVLQQSSGLTPVMELSKSLDTLRKGLHGKWRNRLKVAERMGLIVTSSKHESDFKAFEQIYRTMRKRKQFKTDVSLHQFFQSFQQTEEILRPQVVLCWKDGQVISGVIASTLGDTALYLFGASTEEGMKLYASRLLQWRVVAWAKECGCSLYDLGGSSLSDPWFKGGLCGKNGGDKRLLGPFIAHGSTLNRALLNFLNRHATNG